MVTPTGKWISDELCLTRVLSNPPTWGLVTVICTQWFYLFGYMKGEISLYLCNLLADCLWCTSHSGLILIQWYNFFLKKRGGILSVKYNGMDSTISLIQFLGTFHWGPPVYLQGKGENHKAFVFVFVFGCFGFGLHLWHMEVPRPGFKLKSQLQSVPQLWQCRILNTLCHKQTSFFFFFLTIKC